MYVADLVFVSDEESASTCVLVALVSWLCYCVHESRSVSPLEPRTRSLNNMLAFLQLLPHLDVHTIYITTNRESFSYYSKTKYKVRKP